MEIQRASESIPISEPNISPAFNFFRRTREQISSAIEHGATVVGFAALIAMAGVMYWCPRCGQWMGAGSEGRGDGAPVPDVPPPPQRLIRALSTPLQGSPVPPIELPSRISGRLTPNSGVLENSSAEYEGEPAKDRYRAPSRAHGRRVDTYTEGETRPDDNPHAHRVRFQRGDGEELLIAHHDRDGNMVYDSGVMVKMADDNVYEWTSKERRAE